MTDAEIAEFMDWSLHASDRMKDDPQSFVGRVHRLVAEVRRREQAKLDALKAEVLPVLQIGLAAAPEVAATITTTDIAWLLTHRLTKIWQELGQMRWAGADEGWDLAIEAVRRRLDAECQDVLAWKAQADQSGATAAELLQKVQGMRA